MSFKPTKEQIEKWKDNTKFKNDTLLIYEMFGKKINMKDAILLMLEVDGDVTKGIVLASERMGYRVE